MREHFGAIIKTYPTTKFYSLEGFWPSSNHKVNYECTSIPIVVDVDLEDLVIPPYCGLKNMHLYLRIVAYILFHDLFVGNFILVWPTELTTYHVWMGRAKNDVVNH